MTTTEKIRENEEQEDIIRKRMVKGRINEIFDDYRARELIENELRDFLTLDFEDDDDQIWTPKQNKQDIMLWISWESAEAWIFERIQKRNLL